MIARSRALTHAFIESFSEVGFVEMMIARSRALTLFKILFISVMVVILVEMMIARSRALTLNNYFCSNWVDRTVEMMIARSRALTLFSCVHSTSGFHPSRNDDCPF